MYCWENDGIGCFVRREEGGRKEMEVGPKFMFMPIL
jgi:hypothetical protein